MFDYNYSMKKKETNENTNRPQGQEDIMTKRYAIFESTENEAKCLTIFDSEKEAQEALREGKEWGSYSDSATYYICTDLQEVGETIRH